MEIVVGEEFLGDADGDAELAAWLVESGTAITAGQPIAEIETNKARAEFCSPGAGSIEILVPEGTVLNAGIVIARLS